MRAVQAALALLLAAAGAKNHGDELALFVRQYAEKTLTKTAVDVHRLAAAADAHRKRIRDHYGFDDDVGKKIDEFMTYGRGTKTLERKLLGGIKRGEVRIAQLGISTTAGHDVYHNESFPHVFARHFGAVLRTEGINLQFRNHAVGGFGSMPSHTCVITMAGADNDVVAWDYQMMADRGSCAVEHFVRHLQTDGSAPAVLFWQGGVFLPKDDDHKKRVPAGSNAKQSCGGKWVVDSYSGVGAHSGDFGGLLVHLRRSGFEALKKGSEKLFHEGKGDPPRPDMSEPALPRRRLARHHPAAGLHRLWGLCWAHAYLGVLSRALRRRRSSRPQLCHYRSAWAARPRSATGPRRASRACGRASATPSRTRSSTRRAGARARTRAGRRTRWVMWTARSCSLRRLRAARRRLPST